MDASQKGATKVSSSRPGRLLTPGSGFRQTNCNILSVMNATFPAPPALFCRVDRVLCMFKNFQPPTRPSAIVPRVWKAFAARSCNQIPLILQKFARITFFFWEQFFFFFFPHGYSKRGAYNKSFLHTAFLSLLESRNEDEVGITTLQRADNKPPLPPSLPLICCKRICGPGFGMAAVQGTELPSTPYLFALDTRVVANLPQEDNISL